jgi:hypothetical protein
VFHREIFRVLKPGGLYIATREHVISKREDLEAFFATHAVHKYTQGENAYLVGDYVGAIERSGFEPVKVLRRWESVINYYPTTPEQVRDMGLNLFRSRFGTRLARQMIRLKPLRDAAIQRVADGDQWPGRMYSFLAVKPWRS